MSNINQANTSEGTLLVASRRSLFWRIHVWAALIASPFALIATGTGILYIFTPQIEQALHGSLDHVAPGSVHRTLDELVAAAVAAVPIGSSVRSVLPAYDDTGSVRVNFSLADELPMHAGHDNHDHSASQAATQSMRQRAATETTVYVNPYNATVLGELNERQRFSNWAKKLHSTLLQGEEWRWMIELSASWLMVMLLTGIYLWWPRGEQKALPQSNIKGRMAWKQWHSFVGVALAALTFTMLATGVTWSKYAGTQVRHARDFAGQAPPVIPRDLVSTPLANATMLSWQAAWDAARSQAPDVSMQLYPPKDAQGTWRVSNADKNQPTKKFDLVMDAYTGQALYYAGWDKQTAFSKATAIGIPFHRGELGVWNQFLLMLFGLGMLFFLVSGWIMFFKRKRVGRLGLPTLLPGALKSTPLAAWLTGAGLMALLPLLALSSVVVLAVECYWWWSQPRLAVLKQ